MERRRVSYSGRVQGVGFRFTALRLAKGLPVHGYVENLPDGRVEILAEGAPEVLDGFLAAVRGALGRKIQGESVTREASDVPLSGFTIRD